jgi:putative endonuclease
MPDESFRHQPHTRARGRIGEDRAAEWLRRQGYEIVERNVATRSGEIDVVARDGETLCFIEVKARSNRAYGPAIEAVTPWKQRRLARASALYLLANPTDAPCRFDVLGMDLEDGTWSYTLVRDAFQVPYGSFGR